MEQFHYSINYYKKKYLETSNTIYEYINDKKEWLGYVDHKGRIRQSIGIVRAAALHQMSYREYLLDMLNKGELCGRAEEDATKLKMENN